MKKTRTRFAPSPTGFMHIGNLRTALYEYLIAKSSGGDFILRIEDTDQTRLVEGAEKIIYKTLKKVGLNHDEGPDIGGNFGPYRQSERKNKYLPYAENLVKKGAAYYCFCEADSEQSGFKNPNEKCPCREKSAEETENFKLSEKNFVIRQKMPFDGETTFNDTVFGNVTTPNKDLDDQVLIKSDGFPTYNFANVIDDHEMKITHVVRGSEYLSSTPKYNLLYEAFGWEIPTYIHLPLIMGKNEDGTTSKLSKRHRAVSFEDLINDGYLPEAIINYIAFLGWSPPENREIYSLNELEKVFLADRIGKSPAVFDYKKLDWFNAEYIKAKSLKNFCDVAKSYIENTVGKNFDIQKIAAVLQNRIEKFTQIPAMIDFLRKLPDYDVNLFINKKSKTTPENSLEHLKIAKKKLENLENWSKESIHDFLITLAEKLEIKNATLMWPIRIAISGKAMTPGGAVEILNILGKEESLKRIEKGIEKLS